jgi:hypothetical protein
LASEAALLETRNGRIDAGILLVRKMDSAWVNHVAGVSAQKSGSLTLVVATGSAGVSAQPTWLFSSMAVAKR